jgi:hypothetical protein
MAPRFSESAQRKAALTGEKSMGRPKKPAEDLGAGINEAVAKIEAEIAPGLITNRREEFKQILTQLAERIPDNLIKTRQEGGNELSYIEWHVACDVLDKVVGDWENDIKEVTVVDNKLFITGTITVNGVTRTNIGWEFLTRIDRDGQEKEIAFGDVFTNAFSMYLKRGAALFGVARHLYKKDALEGTGAPANAAPRAVKAAAKPAAVKRDDAARPRSDGKIEAELLGEYEKEKKAGGTYKAFFVRANGREHPVFFDRNFDYGDLMMLVKAGDNPQFPMKCLVTMKKEGKYENIDGFYPLEPTPSQAAVQAQAPSDSAPSSTEPGDYQGEESDIPF